MSERETEFARWKAGQSASPDEMDAFDAGFCAATDGPASVRVRKKS